MLLTGNELFELVNPIVPRNESSLSSAELLLHRQVLFDQLGRQLVIYVSRRTD